MHTKILNKIILSSILSINIAFSNEITPHELSAEQLQTCINKIENLKEIENYIEKRTDELYIFAKDVDSFKESQKGIMRLINKYQELYANQTDQLIQYEFELEELNEKNENYKKIKNEIERLESIIKKYTTTEYYQALITTEKTLTFLSKDGSKYFLEEDERIFQEKKKIKSEKEKIFEECMKNKTIKPEIEKEVCSKNINSFLCSGYKK